jgi:T5orf172 domain
MKGQKLLYIFKDPMGSIDSKVGITGNPAVRFGVYQNSYSRKSHVACFDVVYIGPARVISRLEQAVKQQFNWDIDLSGAGHSEWISQTHTALETAIDSIIEEWKFKVTKVPKRFLPLTTDNLKDLVEHYTVSK